jgi:hypothetical protein
VNRQSTWTRSRVCVNGRRVSAEGGEKAFSFFCGLFASCGHRERTFALPLRRDVRMRILCRRGGLRLGLPLVLVVVAAGLASLAGVTASPVAGSTVATGTLEMKASLHLDVFGLCKPVGIATDCHARTVSGAFGGLGRVTGSYDFDMDLLALATSVRLSRLRSDSRSPGRERSML